MTPTSLPLQIGSTAGAILIASAAMIGLVVLVAVGIWQLSRWRDLETRRAELVSGGSRPLSTEDREELLRAVDDPKKLRNLLVVAAELVVVGIANGLVMFMWTDPGLPVYFKIVSSAAMFVGAIVVGSDIYIRIGIRDPSLETVEDYRESLSVAFDESVAEDFDRAHDTLSEGDREPDLVTATLLATAGSDRSLDDVAQWGAIFDVGDSEAFERRMESLAEADVVENDDGDFRLTSDLSDLTPEQVSTVEAAS